MPPNSTLEPVSATTAPQAEAPKPRLHLDFLDGVRACAALYVVLYHAVMHTFDFRTGGPPQWFALSHFFLQSGRFAVSLFIVISGYCLMLPVVRNRGILKNGAWDFYKRRAKRILPPYYLAIAFSLVCVLTILSKKMEVSLPASLPAIKQWLTFHGLLIQNWQPFFNPRYSEISSVSLLDMMSLPPERRGQMMEAMGVRLDVNGPLWSIAVEWQIYFFFPLLVMLWRKVGAGTTVAIAMLFSYSFFLKFPGHAMAHGWMAPHYLGLFALGMFAANVAHGTEERWEKLRDKRFWHTLAYVLWAAVFLININPLMGLVYSYLVDLIAGPASMCLLIAASKAGPNRLRDLLSRPKLVFLGTFSYSIYLLHDPLLRVLLNTILRPLEGVKVLQYYMLVTVGLAIIIGIAYVFHIYCERPFMNTKPRLKQKEQAGVEA